MARGFAPDVVLDLVGGAYVAESLRSLAVGGTLMLVGLTGGREATLDLGLMLSKRARVIGTVMRARSLAERSLLAAKEIGNLAVGMEADVAVIDLASTPAIAQASARADDLWQALFPTFMMGDDRAVRDVWVGGRPISGP